MTNTATGSPISRPDATGSGPLLTAWGAGASWESLVHSLLPPDAALPAPPAAAGDGDPLGAVRERAEAERGTPWPQPLASQYARYFRAGDGNRTDYESQVFGRQDRLTRAVLMAVATGAERWLDEVADGMVLLCEARP
jgi:hypothetical protein